MEPINLNNRVFVPAQNSENGEVTESTIFRYRQDGPLITAHYAGDTIVDGHIVAQYLDDCTLDMRYHCLTTSGEFKVGKAIAKVSLHPDGKVQLDLDWQWLDSDSSTGTSRYRELAD